MPTKPEGWRQAQRPAAGPTEPAAPPHTSASQRTEGEDTNMSTNITHAVFGGEHDGHSVVVGIESDDHVTVIARGFGFFPASVMATVPLDPWGTPKTWEAEMTTLNRLARRARNDKAWAAAIEYLEANRFAVKDFACYRMGIVRVYEFAETDEFGYDDDEEATTVEPLELNGYERS